MRSILLSGYLAFCLTSNAAAQLPDEQSIVGYKYSCSAKIGDPQSRNAYLYGDSNLNEKGVRTSFYATYQPAWSSTDQTYFLGNRPDNIGKDQTNMRWSLSWRKYDNAYDTKGIGVTFQDATLSLDLSTWKNLPNQVVMTAGQSETGLAQYGKPLHAFASRHLGRKSGAGFVFDLRYIPAAIDQKDVLGWAVFKAPLSSEVPYSALIGHGVVDLKPIRAVQKEFEQFTTALTGNEADYKNKCKKLPIYNDDENDELSIT